MSRIVEQVKAKLEEQLNAPYVEIVDNSWMHAGHAGAKQGGSHLKITIVSPLFSGLGIMDRHRLVHQTLQPEMGTQIHALELKAIPTEEWQGASLN